jgi:hypothetical protein
MQKVFANGSRRRFGVVAAAMFGTTALLALVFAASSPVAFAAADHFVVSAPAEQLEAPPNPSSSGCHKGSVLTVEDDRASVTERRSVMLYAAIDIHKQAFQVAVLDPESGEVVEE